MDHGIWSDTGAWRECIEATLKYKMKESDIRMKRRDARAKSVAAEKRKSGKEEEKKEEKKSTVVVKAGANALKKGFGRLNGRFKNLM